MFDDAVLRRARIATQQATPDRVRLRQALHAGRSTIVVVTEVRNEGRLVAVTGVASL